MRSIKKGFGLIAAACALVGTAAFADYSVTQGSGTTFGSVIIGGIHYAKHVLVDSTGAYFGTSANPIFEATTNGATAAAQTTGNGYLNTLSGTVSAAGTSTTNVQNMQGTVTTYLPQITPTAGLATSFGTTAASLFNANTSRHFMTIQVQGAPDTTGTNGCWINGIAGATADANSLFIPRGGLFESSTHVGTGAVSIICSAASTGVYSRQG